MIKIYPIPTLVWAVGFAPEQPLHVVALACSVSGILKQLQYMLATVVIDVVFRAW
ncbi:MAG: hypothetical protein LBJ00_14610 [Planctomycetaceae bacterium]|jgi:hypothetical protein|nr:hypothetical protein [Planctomycetaceae bacterium]